MIRTGSAGERTRSRRTLTKVVFPVPPSPTVGVEDATRWTASSEGQICTEG